MTISSEERRAAKPGRVAPLLFATAISVTGDGAFTVAVPLLAAALTRDPLTLSVVSASAALPWLLFGLHAGALTDRWPRRRVMIVADLVRAGTLAGFVALLAAGHASIALLAVTVVVVGIGQCLFDSAAQGIIPAIVGRDKDTLTKVNGRFWALDTAGRSLTGPALGSAAFAVARVLPFAVDAVSFLLSAAFVTRLPHTPAPPPPADGRPSITRSIIEGLRFVSGHRRLRALVAIACINNSAYSAAMAIFVLYATQILHVPAAGYGLLFVATATGGVAAGWWAKPLTRRLSYRAVLAVNCLTQGVAWAGIAAAGNVWFTALMLALLGAAASVGTVALVSARQEATPDELLGRVVSVFRLFGIGAASISALAGGAIAAAYSLAATLYTAGLVLIVLGAAIAARPALFSDSPENSPGKSGG